MYSLERSLNQIGGDIMLWGEPERAISSRKFWENLVDFDSPPLTVLGKRGDGKRRNKVMTPSAEPLRAEVIFQINANASHIRFSTLVVFLPCMHAPGS